MKARYYMIIPNKEVTDKMIGDAIQTSKDTLRHSVLNEDRVILKVKDTDRNIIFSKYSKLSHSEVLKLLYEDNKDEWDNNEGEDKI
tara:strand:- start:623 stop:880 length:258 start_codon:yes stop_codon:yes gene_type:complete